MNLGGRSVAVARLVMLMLLVFDAKIASASARVVSACQVSRLTDSSSKTASITMSWPATPSVPSDGADSVEDLVRVWLLELALLDLAGEVAGDPLPALRRPAPRSGRRASPACRRRR